MLDREKDLLGMVIPKSTIQVEWEAQVRPRTEMLLIQYAEPLDILPAGVRIKMREIADRLETGPGLLAAVASIFGADSPERVNYYLRLKEFEEACRALPLRFLDVPVADVNITSFYPPLQYSEEDISRIFYAHGASPPIPSLNFSDVSLRFHSRQWRRSSQAHSKVVTPDGAGYVEKDDGLELPGYVRDQIDCIVKVAESHYSGR